MNDEKPFVKIYLDRRIVKELEIVIKGIEVKLAEEYPQLNFAIDADSWQPDDWVWDIDPEEIEEEMAHDISILEHSVNWAIYDAAAYFICPCCCKKILPLDAIFGLAERLRGVGKPLEIERDLNI